MEELLELLRNSNTRTIEELAVLLDTSTDDVLRRLEYLEMTGVIKNDSLFPTEKGCDGCKGCEGGPAACKGCIPPDVAANMGKVWKVVK